GRGGGSGVNALGRRRGGEEGGGPASAARGVGARPRDGTGIKVAAQNCHWEPQGAYTGEVSVAMLRETGCVFVIVGHAERRLLFGDTNETVNRRARAVLAAGLVPIVCVGETPAAREAQATGAGRAPTVDAPFAHVR